MFNLLTDPWIRSVNGERYSIAGVLQWAGEISDLYGATPLETFGIYRLLIAIANDIYPDGVIQSSINSFVREYSEYFEFDRFMQNPDFTAKISPIGRLVFDLPVGSYPAHLTRRLEDTHLFCPACVSNGLVALPPFSTEGGGGFHPSINRKPPLYFLPQGKSVLDVLRRSVRPLATRDRVNAAWRRQPSNHAGLGDPIGYLHALTFTPRRVRILWENGEAVCTRCGDACSLFAKQMLFAGGDWYEGEAWRDPFVIYNEKNLPLRPYGVRNDWVEFCQKVWAESKPEIASSGDPFRCFGFVTDQALFNDCFVVDGLL